MKIGLLAMSGIRAHDEELLRRGLTLPGFLERSKVIASLPSLALLYLAAVTPDEHEVLYLEAEGEANVPSEVESCDLVAISTYSAQVLEAYAVADRLREEGIKVAMGGLHVTALPFEALQHADYVVVGEGEHVWPAVVKAAVRGDAPRVFRADDFPPVDPASLPVPRYDLLDGRPFNRYTLQTTRGCPWRCEFCASNVMLGRPYRRRPVDQVMRDVDAILEVRPDAFLEFADDNTFVDKTWGKELCRALRPYGLKWFTETDLSVAEDAELLDLMREAGCRQVLIGFESPDAAPLEGMELQTNRKARWADRHAEVVHAIQSHGITVNGCFVLGLDGQTKEAFDRIYAFALDSSLYDVQITILTAFPGTPLYDRLKREGRLGEDGRWDLCTLFDVNHRPTDMTPDELRAGMVDLADRLYSEATTERRRRGFFELARKRGA